MIEKEVIKKKRILFCGVSLTKFSGLGYVISNFLLRFHKDDYEVGYATIIGTDCDLNSMLQWNSELNNILTPQNVYNCQLTDQSKFFKYDDVISEFKPDIVVSCLDPWQVDQIMKSAYRDTYFWLCYLTVETPKYPTFIMYPTPYFEQARKSIVEILNNADLLVPVTQMGKKALTDLSIDTYKDNVFNGIDLTKLPQRKYLKTEVFGNVVKETDFIFMTMGKNMERKKIDLIIKAFDKFLDKVGRDLKYKLYLHTDIESATGGTDLYQLVLDLNIQNHILLSHSFIQGITMSTEDLYKRYSVCDCYITLSSGEGFNYGTCFPGETNILTENGLIPIKDLKKGIKVYTHKGNLKEIIDCTYRDYNDKIYQLDSLSHLPLKMTEGHKIYSIIRKPEEKQLCKINLNPLWNPIEDLKKGDLIAVPKLNNYKEKIDELYITDFVDGLYEEKGIINFPMSRKTNQKISLNIIAKKFGCTFQTVHKYLNPKYKTELAKNIRKHCKKVNYTIPESIKCSNKIILDKEIMEYFGLFIAEGDCSTHSVLFTFHKEETELHNLVIRVSKRLFGNVKVTKIFVKNTNTCRITISSKVTSKFLTSLFNTGSHNKKIPSFLYNSSHICSLIKGYFQGDGCLEGQITAKTVSKQLAFDITTILNMNNVFVSTHTGIGEKDGVKKRRFYKLNLYKQYQERFYKLTGLKSNSLKEKINKTGRRQFHVQENEDYFFVSIKNVSWEYDSLKVYNLHVDQDESYIAEGYTVHNCEAMANKLPVVYINYGGHAEYLKDIGLPVNVKTTYSASNAQMEWAIADTDHAAKQMARAVSDPKWRERASINGYKYAEENFDWEIVYSKLKNALVDGYSKFKRPGIFEFSLKRVV